MPDSGVTSVKLTVPASLWPGPHIDDRRALRYTDVGFLPAVREPWACDFAHHRGVEPAGICADSPLNGKSALLPGGLEGVSDRGTVDHCLWRFHVGSGAGS